MSGGRPRGAVVRQPASRQRARKVRRSSARAPAHDEAENTSSLDHSQPGRQGRAKEFGEARPEALATQNRETETRASLHHSIVSSTSKPTGTPPQPCGRPGAVLSRPRATDGPYPRQRADRRRAPATPPALHRPPPTWTARQSESRETPFLQPPRADAWENHAPTPFFLR